MKVLEEKTQKCKLFQALDLVGHLYSTLPIHECGICPSLHLSHFNLQKYIDIFFSWHVAAFTLLNQQQWFLDQVDVSHSWNWNRPSWHLYILGFAGCRTRNLVCRQAGISKHTHSSLGSFLAPSEQPRYEEMRACWVAVGGSRSHCGLEAHVPN